MSANIGFFTAVKYGQGNTTYTQSILETVDNYFYLGGQKAHVIQGKTKQSQEKAVLSDTNSSLLARIAKVLSYFTLILPFVMIVTKAILRSTHAFRVIDPQKKLEKGISINEEIRSKLKELMPAISARKNNDEITWLQKGNNLVFKLADVPNFVFKMTPVGTSFHVSGKDFDFNQVTHRRFNNMVKAKEVCLANHLGQLVIPQAKKIEIQVDDLKYTLIAEEALDFEPNESMHEELYHQHSNELKEAARQLAIFVARTGFNDVTWRNIPVLNESPEFHGHRRIALIDLEHMQSVANGFAGDVNGSCGLIRCLSEEQIEIVLEEARKQGVAISQDLQDAKKVRLQELESDKKLRQFHEKNGIVTGKEPIEVDLESLGLDLDEEERESFPVSVVESGQVKVKYEQRPVKLRKVAEVMIAEINRIIKAMPESSSIKGMRNFCLNINRHPINKYYLLGENKDKKGLETNPNQYWLDRIIHALIKKNYLYKLNTVNGHGFFIQA